MQNVGTELALCSYHNNNHEAASCKRGKDVHCKTGADKIMCDDRQVTGGNLLALAGYFYEAFMVRAIQYQVT